MPSAQLRAGYIAGCVAAAATAGALLGIGRRLLSPARPFNAIASHALGPRAIDVWAFQPAVTLVGVLLHVIFVEACGVAVVMILTRRPRARPLVTAVGVAGAGLLISLASERLTGTGLAGLLSIGDLLQVYVVMALALAVGVRLAMSQGSGAGIARL